MGVYQGFSVLWVVFGGGGRYGVDMTVLTVPVVRNIREAAVVAGEFDHVVTVGPSGGEVVWGHPDHIVRTFGDVSWGPEGPRYEQIVDVLNWASDRDGSMLVHCHAGMSRSTATAWGIMVGKGVDAEEAMVALRDAHPRDTWGRRHFIPNRLIMEHVARFYGLGESRVNDIRVRCTDHGRWS